MILSVGIVRCPVFKWWRARADGKSGIMGFGWELFLLALNLMGHHRLFYQDAKLIRDRLNEAVHLAEHIHETEKALVAKLYVLDQRKFYVRYGYKSLSGFCQFSLKFSKMQTQRIVTAVRRYEPTDKIVDERGTNAPSATSPTNHGNGPGPAPALALDPFIEAFLGKSFFATEPSPKDS